MEGTKAGVAGAMRKHPAESSPSVPQGSGWLPMAQQAAMFLTAAQRAPEVEHTNSSLMSETLALVCS